VEGNNPGQTVSTALTDLVSIPAGLRGARLLGSTVIGEHGYWGARLLGSTVIGSWYGEQLGSWYGEQLGSWYGEQLGSTVGSTVGSEDHGACETQKKNKSRLAQLVERRSY
jgi:hypothetical protein